jgi:hypothetical protein
LTAVRGRAFEIALSDWPPAMWQQLTDLAGALHGQACHHIGARALTHQFCYR